MKKQFIICALLLTALVIGSCTNGNEPTYDDYASFTWWSSPKIAFNSLTRPDASGNGAVTVGKYVAFQDLSKGALTHEWSISSGCVFITPGFPETVTSNYEQFINPNLGLTTTDKIVNVLFQQSGTFTVTITNTYKDQVIGSVNVNGVWTAVATIVFTVK